MAFWACARLEPRREALAAHCLALAGFSVYTPRLREHRVLRGRRVEVNPPLFPGYCFVAIVLQWHAARWCPGVIRLVMDGAAPARVPDAVIEEIRSRERGGLIELPKPPSVRPGDAVRILRGPFGGKLAIYAGMKPRARVEVLLSLLGSSRRMMLAADAVEAV
jgi:transcriptional antiterminator RfaH